MSPPWMPFYPTDYLADAIRRLIAKAKKDER